MNVIDQARGLPSNSVRDIVCSSDGYYYIGTTNSLQVLTMNYGLRQVNTLTEIYYADDMDADREGHVATVTSGGTLYLLQGGTVLSSRQMTDGKTDTCWPRPQDMRSMNLISAGAGLTTSA